MLCSKQKKAINGSFKNAKSFFDYQWLFNVFFLHAQIDQTVIMYYDRNCKPIEFVEWAAKLRSNIYKVVKYDQLKNVTIWVGFDLSYMDDLVKVPKIFETKIFSKDGKEIKSIFSATEKEALDTHEVFFLQFT